MSDLSKRNNLTFLLTIILAAACLSALTVDARAQGEKLLPPREGSVTDLASVLDYAVSKRLENMLANLKDRAGIELALVTVKTTGDKKIFDYSLQAAREWNIGAIQSKGNSLLLVVSTDDGHYFTQVSRRARGELPDGLLGEMGERMREPFSRGKYGEGLLAAVETFITKMAERRGFSVEGIDQAQDATATTTTAPAPTPQPAQTTASAEPPGQTATAKSTDTPPKEPQAETAAAMVAKEPAPKETTPKESATKEPAPEAAGQTTEPAPQGSPASQSSIRDIFTKTPASKASVTKTVVSPRDAGDKAELDALLQLPPAERIQRLKAFIETHPRSSLNPFAAELIVSAHAALGDEKLQAGDAAGGIEQFRLAIAESPEKMSDALFNRVVSQLPLNLFLRNQRAAAFDTAHRIEARVKDDPKRLLALAGFFLSIEDADEAARLSDMTVKLAPEMAAAHQALGASRHIGLRLDEAAAEYARALELDPKLTAARRSLADLRRASGKTEEALALYREQLTLDASDRPARAGVVLSLFELGKREEAETELASALKDDPRNMALLVGAAYWHAAKGDAGRAEGFAAKAIEIEPRYTWAHIALARSLIAQKRVMEAERVLRYARQYGNFPTLDYELAGALAVSGLYEEAAAELARSFVVKDGQIETRLAGRVPAKAAGFIELLAPERRAGIFQAAAADTEPNARMLKGLIAFYSALNTAQGKSADSAALASAEADFLAGEDAMLAHRQLYAASRLLARGVELKTVIELAEAATRGVEAALDAPVATVAVLGDELREARARAIASGQTLNVGEVPRNVLSNIMRGRIEDMTGWALFNQDKTAEALPHMRRALSVLPENSAWWRTAQWHLGATLEATGNRQEALAAYLKGYNPQAPSPVQRAVIEALYRKVNGSLEGLNEKIGATPPVSSNTSGNDNAPRPSRASSEQQKAPEEKPAEEKPAEEKPAEEKPPVKQP
ncbi:MAG TPA: TPM domain-containing protein [Pyrinomonadaceae bacterium]|nr:TPM domain-containing protein [Pyrinomonadaceae bacterium]